MTCASCVFHVEGALKEVGGVTDARVNLATEKATVEYDIATSDLHDLVRAIDSAGYTARLDRTTLSIGGITSDTPVSLIESALKEVDGVLSAKVNQSNQQATVEYVDSMASITDLRTAIEEAGYNVVGMVEEEDALEKDKRLHSSYLKELRNKILFGSIISIPVFLGSYPTLFRFIPSFMQDFVVL